jgi:WD40 repeat protein
VSVLNTTEWESGVAVIVLGRDDGSVEVWDSDTDQPLVRWKPEGVRCTGQVALAQLDGEHVLVAAWDSKHLGARNLATDEEVLIPLGAADNKRVIAMCLARRKGREVCVTAQADHRLAIWALPELTRLVERSEATPELAYALQIVQDPLGEVLMAGTDTPFASGLETTETHRGTLYLFSLHDLATLWEGAEREHGCVKHLHVATLNGQQLLTVSQGIFGPAEVWDLDRRNRLFEVPQSCSQSWLRVRDGALLLLTVSSHRHTLDLQEIGASPAGWGATRTLQSNVPIAGSGYGLHMAVDARWRFLVAIKHQVLSLELARLTAGRALPPLTITSPIAARDVVRCEGEMGGLFVAATDGRLLRLDPTTGTLLESPSFEKVRPVSALGCTEDGRLLVAVARSAGRVYLIDTVTGRRVGSFRAGTEIASLAMTQWRGRAAVLLGVLEGNRWAARLWDLESCAEVDSERRYSLGEDGRPLQSVGAAQIGGNLRIVFASGYSKVMVANFTVGSTQNWRAFEEWRIGAGHWSEYITSVAIGQDATRHWLAAGTQTGHLKIWDFLSGGMLAVWGKAYQHAINALTFCSIDGKPTLVSGGGDGVLRFWTLELTERFNIDIGVGINAMAWIDPKTLAVATNRGVLAVKVR